MSPLRVYSFILIFVLQFVASGVLYADGAATLEQATKPQIHVDITEDIADPDQVDELIGKSQSVTIFTQDENDNLTYSLKFSPYGDATENRNFVHTVLRNFSKGVKNRPIGYSVMTVLTYLGLKSWIVAAPIHLSKKIGIGLFQVSLQHFFFFGGNIWGWSIKQQVKAENYFLKRLGLKTVIDEGKPIPRYIAVFNTAFVLSFAIRLAMNYDHIAAHFKNLTELRNDTMSNFGGVSTNFTWDYFSSKIDENKYPDAKKFFNYYNCIRWLLVGKAVVLSQVLAGHNGRWAALGVLLTHSAAGYVAHKNSEKVLGYVEEKRLGEKIDVGIEYVKSAFLNLAEAYVSHIEELNSEVHDHCQSVMSAVFLQSFTF